MKIGRFSNENDISIDTIRHYMHLGLITPEKSGGHYDFDERCKEDLEEILSLKGMGFTLNEIKSIFLFKKLGKLTPYQANECFKEFFVNKLSKVNKQLEELPKIKLKLEGKLNEISSEKYDDNTKIGIDISALSLFRCLKCGNDLILHEGSISNNQIINGKLKCRCGEEYGIEDGILLLDSRAKNINNNSMYCDVTEYDYIAEYINKTDPNYLNNIYKGLEWTYKKLDFNELKNKVILDLGSGVGFLLRYIYNDLPDDSLYIAVDHDIKAHKFLKNILEKADRRKKVIFICSDFLDIPLENKLVDILIDNSGSSNYGFEHEDFLLKLIDGYVKDSSLLIGAYIVFKKFSLNSFIGDKCKKNFTLSNIKEGIKKLNYKVVDERTSDVVDKGGKYESYFREDERVYSYMVYGKR
jgi:DNA-binding transcriptional MerR regulator/SAM-dependent methyltransferase